MKIGKNKTTFHSTFRYPSTEISSKKTTKPMQQPTMRPSLLVSTPDPEPSEPPPSEVFIDEPSLLATASGTSRVSASVQRDRSESAKSGTTFSRMTSLCMPLKSLVSEDRLPPISPLPRPSTHTLYRLFGWSFVRSTLREVGSRISLDT